MSARPRKTKDDIKKIINACKMDKKDHKGELSFARVVRWLGTNGIKADDSTASRYWKVYECVRTGTDIPENLCRFITINTWLEYFKETNLLENFMRAIINVKNLSEQERMAIESAGVERMEYEQQKLDLENQSEEEPDGCEPEAQDNEEDVDALRVRVSFELGETARKAIDGLLALVGVKL